ncbi:AraC family transcriptional regulator [Novosphingobium sp.]|uniref:AraC family transcriptional regulator n=1 Tax=Novosphingobium sp. TaxID=1874826 RepID=UPI0025EA3B73|nr:AraC family transcriptional regulator [Novosphingobium sp.]MCC6926329.1 AraC family transcriptional regulator [Novosphingobium sp.]
MKPNRKEAYLQRMQRVLDHIDRHLDQPLDVAGLAAVSAFSPFHFQRQFSALFGLSVGNYIRLLRLKRAGSQLAFRRDETVTAIALDAGYEGNEAFARALRKWLAQSPSELRRRPDWESWQAAIVPLVQIRRAHMTKTFSLDDVRIVEFPATPVVIQPHRGSPARLGESIRKLIEWRRAEHLPPSRAATFNIFHDDPEEVLPEAYRLDLAVATTREPGPGMLAGEIPAGRCAVLRQIGSGDDLRAGFAFLYGEWWPQSGEEARDAPPFAQRISFFPDVAEHEAVTDLYLPLK